MTLAKYLPTSLIKGESYEVDYCKVCDQELSVNEILVAIKYGLSSSIQDEFKNNQEYRCSLTREDWCDLLSTIVVKDDRKRAATWIKKIASDISASIYDSKGSVRIPRKKKARTDVLSSNKGPHNKAPKHQSTQSYRVLCKKSGMPDRNYI